MNQEIHNLATELRPEPRADWNQGHGDYSTRPAVDGQDGPPSAPESLTGNGQRIGRRGCRILVIEDDPASLELYDFLLQTFGYDTMLAHNGEEGLAQAKSARPDLILCDIRLPRLGGVEVMQQLKADASLRRIPIIALTIYSSWGHRDRLLKAGFDGYMAKPTIPEDFIRQIKDFLN